MKDKASSVIVGVADNNLTRGGHILHEQEYNTGHGVSAIPDEVRTVSRSCREKFEKRSYSNGRKARNSGVTFPIRPGRLTQRSGCCKPREKGITFRFA